MGTKSSEVAAAVYTPEMRLRALAARLRRPGQRLRVSSDPEFGLLGSSDLDDRESEYVGEVIDAALRAADLRRELGDQVVDDPQRVVGLAGSLAQLSDFAARRLGDLLHHVLDVVPEPPHPPAPTAPRRDVVVTATVVPTGYREPRDQGGRLVFKLGGEVVHRVPLRWMRGDDPLVVVRRYEGVSDDHLLEVALDPARVSDDYALAVCRVVLEK